MVLEMVQICYYKQINICSRLLLLIFKLIQSSHLKKHRCKINCIENYTVLNVQNSMLQNVLTITIGHSLPLVALIRSVSDFKSLNFEYIAIQRQMDLPHSLLDKLFALENILVSLVSELRGCLTHFPYYVCRDSSSYNIIIIFIGFYCANINPGKEIFICAWHWLSKILFDKNVR